VDKAMAKIEPFERHRVKYEKWFEKNVFAYKSELQAVRYLLPKKRTGVEIGVAQNASLNRWGLGLGLNHRKQ
jgi:hypothetical protein